MIGNHGIIASIIIGLLAGGIAKMLMPGRDPGGCFITILLGIGGAVLANFLGRTIGWSRWAASAPLAVITRATWLRPGTTTETAGIWPPGLPPAPGAPATAPLAAGSAGLARANST